jgi:hypothetical protein
LVGQIVALADEKGSLCFGPEVEKLENDAKCGEVSEDLLSGYLYQLLCHHSLYNDLEVDLAREILRRFDLTLRKEPRW